MGPRWWLGSAGAAAVLLLSGACAGMSVPAGGPGSDARSEPVADPVVDRPIPDSTHAEELAAGLNEVGYRLFRAAAADTEGDLVLSPFSIGVAFGMADAGASGPTARPWPASSTTPSRARTGGRRSTRSSRRSRPRRGRSSGWRIVTSRTSVSTPSTATTSDSVAGSVRGSNRCRCARRARHRVNGSTTGSRNAPRSSSRSCSPPVSSTGAR